MRACYTSYPKRMFFIEVDKHINRAMLWQSSAVTAPPKKSLETQTHTATHSHRPLAQCISLTTKASDFLIQPPSLPPWLYFSVNHETYFH